MEPVKLISLVVTVLAIYKETLCEEAYDFVVIGAGSAGAPLTERLSADGEHSVLLLEKGPERSSFADVPALATAMFSSINADKYLVEKQEGMAKGLIDQQIIWLKGMGLGGTSLMNYMAYTRGHREFYDRWGRDCAGWSYDEVKPYFKDIERARVEDVQTSERGTDGEIDVGESSTRSEVARAFVAACRQTGMKFLKDYNAEDPFGVGYFQASVRDGRRCDTGKAFLGDVGDRKNLKIKINSLATRLVIDNETKKVKAVEYRTEDGAEKRVRVNKEVILSAGAFATPQLLMLSGVGPAEHLKELGIEVVEDLPVGRTITDHLIYPGLVFKVNASISPTFQDILDPKSWENFMNNGEGWLTVPGLVAEALGFVKTPLSDEEGDYPDMEFLFLSGSFNTDMGTALKLEWRISDEAYVKIWKPLEGTSVWSAFPMMFRPRSKGHMKLRSKDPADRPLLYPNYMTDEENFDVRTMIAAIRMLQEVNKQPALAKYGSELVLVPTPGCEDTVVDSDEYWECHLRHFATTSYHQQSSCKMGPQGDEEAVVDERLRVRGIGNLRVADLSVLPSPITAHPSIPSAMIGVRAADFILGDHGSEETSDGVGRSPPENDFCEFS